MNVGIWMLTFLSFSKYGWSYVDFCPFLLSWTWQVFEGCMESHAQQSEREFRRVVYHAITAVAIHCKDLITCSDKAFYCISTFR